MKYPVSRLPKAISMALDYEICKRRKWRLPNSLTVSSANSFNYYMRGVVDKVGFVLETSLILQQGDINPRIANRLQYCKDKLTVNYLINWGTYNGDLVTRTGVVNTDKIDRPIEKGNAVTKCYVDRNNNQITGEIFFREDEMLPKIRQIELSDRDRELMFVCGRLHGSEQAIALVKLSASKEEIKSLLERKAIKHAKSGYAVDLPGLAAQSDEPKLDRW
jgi:hypothetical protein